MSERIITLKREGLKENDSAQCHLMPCRIEHKGKTVRAREYFWPTIRELKAGGDEDQGREEKHAKKVSDENNDSTNPILTASFRGRPLQGRKVVLPDGYCGYLVDKEANGNKTSLKAFGEFTYWNWDEIPSNSDSVVKALQWINISKAIHGNPKTNT